MMKKYVFIHAPELPNTIRSLHNIVGRIVSSGMDYDRIYFCCTKGFAARLEGELPSVPRSSFIDLNSSASDFEYPTLEFIHRLSNNGIESDGKFYCLYMHAKGASKTSESEFQNALDWTDYMLHGVVDNYKMCIGHLDNGADLVGSQWHWHFKGNFWWGNSEHLKRMPDPLTLTSERFNAEYWCCLGYWWPGLPKPEVRSLFYLPDLQDDSKFTDLHNALPIEEVSLDKNLALIDKRIDPSQPWTISEFLDLNYKCALSSLYMVEYDTQFAPVLADYLNYDAEVIVLSHDEDGTYKTYSKPEFCKEFISTQ